MTTFLVIVSETRKLTVRCS